MGTRGCVAVNGESPDFKQWRGCYNHWDSYPTGLGKEVWDTIQSIGVKAVVDGVTKVGDWREFLSGGVCEFCGKVEGQPVDISSRLFTKPDSGEFPDPLALNHSHAEPGDGIITSEAPDPLFIEWVYVIEPATMQMAVMAAMSKPGYKMREVDAGEQPVLSNDGYWHYGHCAYKHVIVTVVGLTGPDPDWAAIEKFAETRVVKAQIG
jgi:hypothetical protein